MSKMEMIKNTVVKTAGRSRLVLQKYSPEILMTVGVVGIVGSTVLACRATLKADEVLDTAKSKLDQIHTAKATIVEEEYSETDYKRDIVVAYVQTGVDFIKLYGPAVTLGVASIGCILGAHGIMRKRNLALVAAYKAIETSFADYRERVVNELGIEKDREFKYGIKQQKEKVEVIDPETGKKKKVEVTNEVIDAKGISQYARWFDEASPSWCKNAEYNMTFLICQQRYANDLLNSRGHIFLNEVYDALGIPRSQAGQIVGWVKGCGGDDYVDFGIFNRDYTPARDFVNGNENHILLDFNVDGVVYDKI